MVLIIWMTMYICALNFVFGCWVLSLIFVWQGLDNMLWVHRHRFWNLLCCIELSPCQVSQAGADYFLPSGEVDECSTTLLRCFGGENVWHIYYWRARLEQHLLHHAVLLSEILKCFLDRCLNSQSFSWTVDSRTSRNGQNWSKKEFSGDNARWIVMDIELLDNYILCEYFSIVEKRSYVLAHFLIWEKISFISLFNICSQDIITVK